MSTGFEAFRQAAEPPDSSRRGRLHAKPMSEYPRRRVEFVLPYVRLPRGVVSVVVGWQGIGKGTITAALAADVTQAGHGVAYVSDEDSVEATIRPRLEAAGADLDRVRTLAPADPKDHGGVLLPRDLGEIRELVVEFDLWLLLLDPWTNHVDVPDVDKGGRVRGALMPLARMCRDTGLATVLSAHPNRRTEVDDPLATIAHASAVSQVARAVFFVGLDPDQGSTDAKVNRDRLLIHHKANMTRHSDTLRYRLEDTLLEADGEWLPEVETVRAERVGISLIGDVATARARLKQIDRAAQRADEDDTATGRCATFLREFLADVPVKRADVLKAAKEENGWSERTVDRAAHRIGVDSWRPEGAGATSPAWWSLPAGGTGGRRAER